jgi:hypothetical protein
MYDCNFIEVKFIEVEFTSYGENKLKRKNSETDLEDELRMVRKNISIVKDQAKKSKMINAYEGLVELLIA